MTEKADRGLVGAEETVRSFHQKKETEKQPQLPNLPHFVRCWAGPTPQAPQFVGMSQEGSCAVLYPFILRLPTRQAGEAWRRSEPSWGLLGAVPCPTHPATLTRSLTSPHPLCLP